MTLRNALLAALLLLLTPVSAAQSLAQIRLGGALTSAARVEIEVGAVVKGQPRVLELGVFLAGGTTPGDVASLLAGRLESASVRHHRSKTESGCLFIEDALFVALRLDGGLTGSVTACEGVPQSLKVIAPGKGGKDMQLVLSANALHPVTRDSKTVGLTVPLTAGNHPVQNCEALMQAAVVEKWGCDRPKTDLWRPMRLSDGSRLEGISVGTHSGWRVEVTLAQPPADDE